MTKKDLQTLQDRVQANNRSAGNPSSGALWDRRQFDFIIGIDTGVKTGVAIWDRKGQRLISCGTWLIHEALKLVKSYHGHHKIFVRVEDARLRTFIPAMETEKAERGRRQGAGSVKRDASIWEGFLHDAGIAHEMVAPKQNATKLNARAFKSITSFNVITSQHARDAAMLVFGL